MRRALPDRRQDPARHDQPARPGRGFAVVGRSDRALHTAQHIHEQLIYILGGRAAEHVINGTVSSGAANDLEKANAIARAAVEQYGLSAAVGQVVATQSGFSEQTKATVDSEVRRIVEDAYRDAIAHGRGAPRAARAPHPGPAEPPATSTTSRSPPRWRAPPSPPAARTCSRCPTPTGARPDLDERRTTPAALTRACGCRAADRGQAIAAFRAERDDSHRGPAARA